MKKDFRNSIRKESALCVNALFVCPLIIIAIIIVK